jgi:hypothetical protein
MVAKGQIKNRNRVAKGSGGQDWGVLFKTKAHAADNWPSWMEVKMMELPDRTRPYNI